jgi:hypothetical protein
MIREIRYRDHCCTLDDGCRKATTWTRLYKVNLISKIWMPVAQIPHFLLGFTLQSVVSLAPVSFLVFPEDIEGCGLNDDTRREHKVRFPFR